MRVPVFLWTDSIRYALQVKKEKKKQRRSREGAEKSREEAETRRRFLSSFSHIKRPVLLMKSGINNLNSLGLLLLQVSFLWFFSGNEIFLLPFSSHLLIWWMMKRGRDEATSSKETVRGLPFKIFTHPSFILWDSLFLSILWSQSCYIIILEHQEKMDRKIHRQWNQGEKKREKKIIISISLSIRILFCNSSRGGEEVCCYTRRWCWREERRLHLSFFVSPSFQYKKKKKFWNKTGTKPLTTA